MINNFEEWVEIKCKECLDNSHVDGTSLKNDVYIMYNYKTHKTGIARCHPKDKYDFRIGIAIAYARCMGQEIPKQITYKKLNEMKSGERFKCYPNIYRFIGECEDYQGQKCYAVQNLTNNCLERMTSTIEYEMVD